MTIRNSKAMLSVSRLFCGLTVGCVLSACSTFEPEYIACPDIRVKEGAEKAVMIGADYGHYVTMRVNGVDGTCTEGDGFTDMKVELGLLFKREGENLAKAERVPLDVTFAFLNDQDELQSRYVYSYDLFIPNYQAESYPVAIINIEVPDNTRVIFGLGKAE